MPTWPCTTSNSKSVTWYLCVTTVCMHDGTLLWWVILGYANGLVNPGTLRNWQMWLLFYSNSCTYIYIYIYIYTHCIFQDTRLTKILEENLVDKTFKHILSWNSWILAQQMTVNSEVSTSHRIPFNHHYYHLHLFYPYCQISTFFFEHYNIFSTITWAHASCETS